ncbi:hypothetical protein [Nocardia sp. NPDC050717]|uniref:hypothetical protein n=1 Tax=Nocardia sp. NPDC050717 TaxID=3157221 RepID=UPI0033C5D6CD
MSSDSQSERRGHHPDGFAEFTEELRLLAEVLLARVEPVLRRTAADGQADLGGCAWCPVCAAAALVRGDHHDVVAALAEHGTSMVTVLREALAGVPVDPVFPPEWAEYAAAHHDSHHAAEQFARAAEQHQGTDPVGFPDADRPHTTTARGAATASGRSTPAGAGGTAAGPPASGAGATAAEGPHGSGTTGGMFRTEPPTGDAPAEGPRGSGTAAPTPPPSGAGPTPGRSSRHRTGTPRPRRVDEYAPPQTPAPEDSGIGLTTSGPQRAAEADRSRAARAPRSRYVDIPVTIRG